MATHLQHLLRSLCSNTEWNYAVFWKLKHQARMVLTWEDAFYNNQFELNPLESKGFGEAFESLHDGHVAHDLLSAIAKMSYHAYSLGEGIVGQVAVTGKHRWIFAGEQAMSSCSSLELCDGWQSQFAAGIKTVVVAVVPHGVVQLGSLNKVNENLQLLTHIRHVFSSLQELARHIPTPVHDSQQNILQTLEICAKSFGPNVLQEWLVDLDKTTNQLKAESDVENQPELSCLEALSNLNSSSIFSGGTELHEAFGPAFIKQSYPESWESETLEEKLSSQMPESTESSLLTTDFGIDHLLEAVVANFCGKDPIFKSEKSLSTSESILTSEKMPDLSISSRHTIGSSSYYSVGSSTSVYRDPLVRPVEKGKPNKKRARPGESSQPLPRDRQLIQDRIKELRELVPNGSKCSIDSLLERTIKHMIFMQSVTKHADKLNNCVKSRGCSNETGVLGSGYEQGSSWAVEVGGHTQICPVVVENLNVNGQMLIEMLCEDCDHVLEIIESIRSLGLTILKGMTNNHGDKTWMRFVVESQSNMSLHRIDILWSLVQLLQQKRTV